MGHDICLVEAQDKWQSCLVHDAESIQDVRHEGIGVLASHSVDHVDDDCWHGTCQTFCDDLAGCAHGEDFNLAWGVENTVICRVILSLNELYDLVELSAEEIEGSKNASVGPKTVCLHDLFIVY